MVSLVLVRGVYKLGMGGAEHFPAGRGEDKNPRGGVGLDEGENPQKRHFCEESQSVNKVK